MIPDALQQVYGKQFGLLFNTDLWDIQPGGAVPGWGEQKGWSVLCMHTDHGPHRCIMLYVLKRLQSKKQFICISGRKIHWQLRNANTLSQEVPKLQTASNWWKIQRIYSYVFTPFSSSSPCTSCLPKLETGHGDRLELGWPMQEYYLYLG